MNPFRTLRAPAGRQLLTGTLVGATLVRARAPGAGRHTHQTLPTRLLFGTAGAGAAFMTQSHTRGAEQRGPPTNFFMLKAQGKRHQEVSMRDFENKVVLVVNVASKCGFTDQYAELEALYKTYKDKGFTVIGFPCNQFGGQVRRADESNMFDPNTLYFYERNNICCPSQLLSLFVVACD